MNKPKPIDAYSHSKPVSGSYQGKVLSHESLKQVQGEVIILGGGISGMITALGLADRGIKTNIIEAKTIADKSFFSDVRTTAFTPNSRRFLSNIEIWQEIEQKSGNILDIYVIDNKNPNMLKFSAKNAADKSALGYIIKNPDLKKILLQKVKQSKLITLSAGCEYTTIDSYPEHNVLHLQNGGQLECPLIIVCDGRLSSARNYYFSDLVNKSYQQNALVFDAQHDKPHEGTAVEHFMPAGPFAILPMQDQNLSSIVWTVSQEHAALLTKLPRDEFEYLLQNNFGPFLGKVTVAGAISSFPLKARLAKEYFYQRLVLAADTAHTIHPLAGQGLNQGIKDIEVLVDLISKCGISSTTFEKYQTERQSDNTAMYFVTDKLNSLFGNNSRLLHYFRATGLRLLNEFAPLKENIIGFASGE